jgi:hypothetical protein
MRRELDVGQTLGKLGDKDEGDGRLGGWGEDVVNLNTEGKVSHTVTRAHALAEDQLVALLQAEGRVCLNGEGVEGAPNIGTMETVEVH